MAIEQKMTMAEMIQHGMEEVLTVKQMKELERVIREVMAEFIVNRRSVNLNASEDDIMQAYISALEVGGRSKKTIDRYKFVLKKMMEDMQVGLRQVTVYHLREWLTKEKSRGLQDSSLESERSVMSSCFNWLWREGLIEKNPVANLTPIKCEKKVKKIFTPVDIELLLGGCRKLRDRAIIMFMNATGCRISEVMSLNRDSVDFERNQCIVHGKGNKQRIVYIDNVAGLVLRRYLSERTDDNEALFVNKKNERLQANGVRMMLKELAKEVGVEHCHPHKFRRTRATTLVARGMPIQEVAAILGHEKLDTTMEYLVLNNEGIKSSYLKWG